MCSGKYQFSFDSREEFNSETCCDVFVDSMEEALMYANHFKGVKERNPIGISFDSEMNMFFPIFKTQETECQE